MKILGLWPTAQKGIALILKTLFVAHLSATTITLVILEFMYLLFDSENYYDFLKSIGTVSYHSICVLRILHWISIQKQAEKIWKMLERETFEAFMSHANKQQECRRFMESASWLSFAMCYMMNIGGFLSLLISYVETLIAPVEEYDYMQNRTITKRVFPYNSYSITKSNSTRVFIFKFLYNLYTMHYTNLCIMCMYTNTSVMHVV